jgi:hypothetical protein
MEDKHFNALFQSGRYSYEIAKLLLEHVFVNWTYEMESDPESEPDSMKTTLSSNSNLSVRRFLVTDFYQLLYKTSNRYYDELSDFTKNNDYHYNMQQKIKVINEILHLLDGKEFHSDVIYYMTLLSPAL